MTVAAYSQCDCTRTAIRWRVMSNGVGRYVIQCLTCGREIRAISKTAPEVRRVTERTPFDEELRQQWQQGTRLHWQGRREEIEQEKVRESAEWWQRYNTYLLTSAWRARRQAVLTRAGGICEGCLQRQATQVHHTSYEHVGNELLFELVAVCDRCHHVLHPDMDDR